jgi:hypothetical protein
MVLEETKTKAKRKTRIDIETWLPLFPGFYETLFDGDEDCEMDDINTNRRNKGLPDVEWEKINWDWEGYKTDVTKECVTFVEEKLKELFSARIRLIHEGVYSPKEYNFDNDAVNIKVVLSKKALFQIKLYLITNKVAYSNYLERYTSYDGFMSFHSNDYDRWITEYWDKIETNQHYMGSILEFIMRNEEITVNDMYEGIDTTYVNASNHLELSNGEDVEGYTPIDPNQTNLL